MLNVRMGDRLWPFGELLVGSVEPHGPLWKLLECPLKKKKKKDE